MSYAYPEETGNQLASNEYEEVPTNQSRQDIDTDLSEEGDDSSEHVPGRRSVRVTVYSSTQESKILRIWIDRTSTYGGIQEGLTNLHGNHPIMVLQAVYGPKPYWIEPNSVSTIGNTCVELYAVIVMEDQRYSLGVVRTALLDYPMAIFDSMDSPAIAVSQRIVTAQPTLAHRVRSIMHFGTHLNAGDVEYDYELLRKVEHSTFPTVFFITVDEAPGSFVVDASDDLIPPFLQIQFVHCRDLLQRAYNLNLLPLQAIHVSRAIYHLVVSLATALGGGIDGQQSSVSNDLIEKENLVDLLRVAPIIAGNLQSILGTLEVTVKALEGLSVNPEEAIADFNRMVNTLCGDYPGAVVVRQSFGTFERLVRMDREDIIPSVVNEEAVRPVVSSRLDRATTVMPLQPTLAQPVNNHRDMRYPSTYAALDASFNLLTARCQHLLRLLSCFHWSNFPLELVILAAKHSFSGYRRTYLEHGEQYYAGRAMLERILLHEGKWEVNGLEEMIVSLRNHSLITLGPGVGTQLMQMHPVAHGWAKSCIPKQEEMEYQSGAILLLAFGSREEYTPSVQYLTGHITHLRSLWDRLDINNAEAFADILHQGGSFEGALQLRERVVRELRSRVEPHSMEFSDSLWALALSYRGMGRYKEAEKLQEEVLKLRKEILGERHPDTITAANNLAITYRNMGRPTEAVKLQEEVLKLRKEILGERHPDTITASNNLANTYRDMGRPTEAVKLQGEVLKLRKEILGERHPHTITASNNLAITYRDMGRPKEAEEVQKEVLKLRKEILGERHPDTITAANNLANTYCDLGRLKEAEELQEEVLKLRKEILGQQHPGTITALNNLAITYRDMGRLKKAEEVQKEVLKLRKEILGERHPDTITASNNLANTYRDMERLKEAEELQEEVLKLRKEMLGGRHPHTITASNNLAITYCDLGRLKEAEQLELETLMQAGEVLGKEHPITIFAMLNMAQIYALIGKKLEALKYLDTVEPIIDERLGKNHPRYTWYLDIRTGVEH